MFSKLSYTIGASFIALATLDEVQAIKSDTLGNIKLQYGCAACITNSGVYYYGTTHKTFG